MKTNCLFAVATLGLLAASLGCATNNAWTETLTAPPERFLSAGRNDYFILEPGYRLVLEGVENGRQTALTITVLNEIEKIGDVETRIVEEREVTGGRLAEVSRNYFAAGADSKNIYYFGEDVDLYQGDRVVHEGAWREGRDGAKHGIAMPGTIKIGDRYYQEQAPKVAMDRAENVSTGETIKTADGTFEHCLKTKETSAVESGTEYKLYAPGAGLVKEGELELVKHGFIK